ncbi:hypothetical protein OCK74_09365 [Chitinophagaceae bacterium LB-8]|uniref:Uncharacterized protein n=1 Tax=Paraflavisolibacter caeni TaxID=2982496 RepID=A0A9X3BHX2_9BACT|nr:hypothetical protein [Paraflavisolibacter caeni]MCU7549323.1 hypothetical protein [Paraflavisolibacter caeni]
MAQRQYDIVNLKRLSLFTLFITSYIPLFALVIFRQFYNNWEFLHWGGLSIDSLHVFVKKFGVSTVLLMLSVIGLLGYFITFSNIRANAANGALVLLKDVKNKNSEAIGYIATYIIPFLFQNFETPYEIFAFSFLLFIIYRIYINSNMLLINPLLTMRYAIYEIEYESRKKKCNGLVVTKEKFLPDDTEVKLYEIGHKLYFLTVNE